MSWTLALLGCVNDGWEAPAPPPAIVAGPPTVGAAEGYLVLPVGTPLAGYTARCSCLGSFSRQDDRDSSYTTSFIESTGVQTYPVNKVVWLENGDDHLVITKSDLIYSFDGLVEDLTARLEERTGETLKGRVVHTTNHSHSSYGTFNHGVGWYLGSDRFDRENYERLLAQLVDVAMEAYDSRVPAKIGVGWTKDWDPNDRVYSDRRGDNNDLHPWPDGPDLLKDPHLGLIRFDTVDDDPIAMIVNFGMHGILGSESNPMVSSDSGGGLETVLQDAFDDKVVVMFTQGSGGDASPRGEQDDFATMETIGEFARDAVLGLREATVTSADAFTMETVSRAIPKHPSVIEVTREGTVDWRYAPFDESPVFFPDDVIYDQNGEIISPLDEFNAAYGAVFCGSGDLDFPVGGLASNIFPYDQCMQVDLLSALIEVFFELEDGELLLPLPETLRGGTTVSRLGPLPTLLPDGTQVVQDLLVGFFPGEPVYSYGEQWRRRVKAELGFEQAMIVGYSQDHEGYLLIPEDWLAGGYEPDITIWGPLEAEYIMERVLAYSKEFLLTPDVREDPDPLGQFGPTVYPDAPLGTIRPDPTPDAGTRITTAQPYLWTPFLDLDDEYAPKSPTAAELVVPAQVPRVQGIVQVAWHGGDPMADSPKVVLEREVAGVFVPVTTPSGRVIDEGRHDILMGQTPTPLYPADALQTHTWWAAWQVVGHVRDRAALPLGTYRLHVSGTRYAGTATTWPWDTVPYDFATEAFEVVPGELTVTEDPAGLLVSLAAPVNGYRLIAMGGDEDGDNPIVGPATVDVTTGTGTTTEVIDPTASDPRSLLAMVLPVDWVSVTVTDAAGNQGTLVR